LDAFPDQNFVATLEAIDSSVEGLSHSIALRASISNDDGRLRSGLYANISLIIGEKTDAVLIPESALLRDGNKEMVYVVQEGKAFPVNVVVGTRENGMVELLTQLKDGLKVVTSGQIKLVPGRAVTTQGPKPEDALKALAQNLGKSKEETKSEEKPAAPAKNEPKPEAAADKKDEPKKD